MRRSIWFGTACDALDDLHVQRSLSRIQDQLRESSFAPTSDSLSLDVAFDQHSVQISSLELRSRTKETIAKEKRTNSFVSLLWIEFGGCPREVQCVNSST